MGLKIINKDISVIVTSSIILVDFAWNLTKFIAEFLQKHKGVSDPLEVVAGEISDEAILLCLDEFMVY